MNRDIKILMGVGIVLISQTLFAEHRLAPERRRPLQRLRSFLRGTDISVRHGGGQASACQSVPVAKKELQSGLCRVAFHTAAHCMDSAFKSIMISGLGEIPQSQVKVSIPDVYFKSGGSQSRTPNEGDSATFAFDMDCDKLKDITPVPLAQVKSNGVTQVSNHVYLQKRQGEISGNRGEGAQILADVMGEDSRMFNFKVPSPQGYAIVGGDSGGPIFNENGELVCPISGSSYEFQREQNQLRRLPDGTPDAVLDPFTVVCDKFAISRLRADLARLGLAPENSLASESPLQRRPTIEPSPESKDTLPSPNRSASNFNGFRFQARGSGTSRGLHFSKEGQDPSSANALFLKKMPDGGRRAAIKTPQGDVVILGEDVQQALRQYYESQNHRLGSLTPQQRLFVEGFLQSFEAGSSSPSPSDRQSDRPSVVSAFECTSKGEEFRIKTSGENSKLLGSSGFQNREQCEQAVTNARNGVVCTPTEEGFKATHQSGSVAWEEFAKTKPFGYLGGGPLSLEQCIETTLKSTSKAICYRSASLWLAGDINGTGKLSSEVSRGPYESLQECNQAIQEKPKNESSEKAVPSPKPAPKLSEADQKAIDFYENGMKYIGGHPRERFPQNMFKDLPPNGTGKIILAYFGNKDPQLEAAADQHPLIDVRNYPIGSPEHQHARLFGTQALGLDGLGRKITRYAMSPRQAFNSLASSDEVGHLERYLQAKKGEKQGTGSNAQQNPPIKQHPPINGKEVSALLESSCIQCHQNQKGLPQTLKSASGLLEQLKSANDNTLEDMAERAGLESGQLQKLKNFRDGHSSSPPQSSPPQSSPHQGSSKSPQGSSSSPQQNRRLAGSSPVDACYTSDAERRSQIESLPEFDVSGSPIASAVNSALNQGTAVFYNKKSVPRTWQSRDQILLTERNAINPNMYAQMGYHSDGAREFPWDKPAGTDVSGETIDSEKFFIPGESGKLAKLVSRTKSNSPSYYGKSVNVNGPNLGWNFETGATLGEVLKVKDPETGEGIPFEIRIRRKNNQGVWQMDVLRPFENPDDLLGGLKKLCVENKNPPAGCAQVAWSKIEKPDIRVFDSRQFVNQKSLGTRLDPLKLSSTAASALSEKASLQVLPDLPPDVVRALLKSTPFKSVFGKPWTQGQEGAQEGWAPTTNSNFNIVPKNYFGGFIPMNQVSCMKCHESAGRHVDNFDPKRDEAAGIVNLPSDATRSRTWYNFIPGNDGILSFHPWDANRVRQGGAANRNSLNDCLKRAGLLE